MSVSISIPATKEDVKASRSRRNVGSFQSAAAARKYWIILGALIVAGLVFAFGLLAYDNPMDFGTRKWWLIARRRADAVTPWQLSPCARPWLRWLSIR